MPSSAVPCPFAVVEALLAPPVGAVCCAVWSGDAAISSADDILLLLPLQQPKNAGPQIDSC